MKRLLMCLLLCSLLLTMAAPGAFATETTAPAETVPETTTEETAAETTAPTEAPTESTTEPSTEPPRPANACGEDLLWSMDGTTLTISGTGAMDSFYEGAPWAEYQSSIETVILTGGVTTVGACAFTNYDNLTSVDFGSSLREIDTAAFKNCDGLTNISLPATFRRFGEESFYGCSGLKEIHCSGGMPSFNMNCLWASYLTIYFPTNNPWPLVHIEQLETAFQGRIEFLAADGSDPYVPTEPTEATQPETTAPATEATEATQPETTAPTTVPTTVPVTEATEAPTEATTAPTQAPTTEATEATQPETTEATEATEAPETPGQDMARGGLFGLIMICVVLTALVIAALVFRWRRSGGKYSR